MTPKPSPTRRIDDAAWLRGVRSDVDSSPADWVAKTPDGGLSKLAALTDYLDKILDELGHPGPWHKCAECGVVHRAKETK